MAQQVLFRIGLAVFCGALLAPARPAQAAGQQDQELRRAREENEALRKQLAEREKQIVDLMARTRALLDQLRAAQINERALRERTEKILAELQEAQRELARLRAGKGNVPKEARPRVNPPPNDVRGTVTRMDADGGLIEISLGADAGLKAGHTLEVFRVKPTPTYLGTLEVVRVMPNRAVGRLTGRPGAKVQAGDRVASRIKAD